MRWNHNTFATCKGKPFYQFHRGTFNDKMILISISKTVKVKDELW